MLSIVSTLYNSAPTIEEFVGRALAAGEVINSDHLELILVDDGSPDDSLAIACELAESDSRIRVVELSRNFGHHKAMMTGLEFAKGDLVFLIDSDLEESPELLLEFHGELIRDNCDVVYGYQRKRKGRFIERWTGAIFYKIINCLVPYHIPRNHVTVRLMQRPYVDSLVRHKEQQTIIGGLWVITGYDQRGLPVNKRARGKTSYSFKRRWFALIDSITCFSEVPLVLIFYLGLAISLLAVFVAIALAGFKIWLGSELQGWVSVMLSVWFLGGLIIFCLGTIGIYISKIFIETKNRPYTIVRAIHGENP